VAEDSPSTLVLPDQPAPSAPSKPWEHLDAGHNERLLRAERVRLLFGMLRVAMPVGTGLALILAIGFYQAGRLASLSWFAVFAITHAVAFAVCTHMLRWRVYSPQEVRRREAMHVGLCFVLGSAWGSSFVVLEPDNELWRFFQIAVGMGLSLAAIPLYAALLRSFAAFIIPIWLGCAYVVLADLHDHRWQLLVMCVMVVGGTAMCLWLYRRLINSFMRHRLRNQQLVAELMTALEDPSSGMLRLQGRQVRFANHAMEKITGLSQSQLRETPLEVLLGPGPLGDTAWQSLAVSVYNGLPYYRVCDVPNTGGNFSRMQLVVRDVMNGPEYLGAMLLFRPTADALAWARGSVPPERLPCVMHDELQWMQHAMRMAHQAQLVQGRAAMIAVLLCDTDPHIRAQLMPQVLDRLMVRLGEGDAIYQEDDRLYLWVNITAEQLALTEIRASLLQTLMRAAGPDSQARLRVRIGAAESQSVSQGAMSALQAALADAQASSTRR
jgi:PAS domain-containing protein